MVMNFALSGDQVRVEGQATYGMSNLRPKTTGLNFIVFISQKDDASHSPRVKWSPMPKVIASQMGSYAIEPFRHVIGPRLDARGEAKLSEWVEINKEILLGYWNGDVPFTEDAVEQLKPV